MLDLTNKTLDSTLSKCSHSPNSSVGFNPVVFRVYMLLIIIIIIMIIIIIIKITEFIKRLFQRMQSARDKATNSPT